MSKKTINDIDVTGKRVLIRVDFNVPMSGGVITDDRRIAAAVPTIKSVIDRGGRAILMSHMGRPKGAGFESSLSLRPVAAKLGELLGKPVAFPAEDALSHELPDAAASMRDGDLMLLENLRFHAGEKSGDPGFGEKLAEFGEVYVNDAFGTCHRADASMLATPQAMHNRPCVVGLLVEKEIRYLSETLDSPESPFVVVLGGAKVSDKLPAIERLIPKADHIVVGGAMAYTFLKALGRNVGASRVEEDRLDDAKAIIEHAANNACELHLPEDHVCGTAFTESGGDIETFADNIKDGFIGLDIGPKSQFRFSQVISTAKTIVWNGPMGVFEWRPFSIGTQQIAKAIADATENGATSIVGGGDSAAAVEKFGLAAKMSHVSTGGGASLAMLEGKRFAPLEHIEDK